MMWKQERPKLDSKKNWVIKNPREVLGEEVLTSAMFEKQSISDPLWCFLKGRWWEGQDGLQESYMFKVALAKMGPLKLWAHSS